MKKMLILTLFLTGCSSMSKIDAVSGVYAPNVVAAVTASPEELKAVGPKDQPSSDECARKQRIYKVVSGLPPVQAWVTLNNLWIDYVRKNHPNIKMDIEDNLSPCVTSPYAGTK